MERLFTSIYHLILKFKGTAFAFFLILILASAFYASKITLSEDVSKLLPEKDIPSNLMENLEAIDFADRLFFHLQLNDSATINPDLLLETADSLIFGIQKEAGKLVSEVQFKINPSSIDQVYPLIVNYLPYYLEEKDYVVLDKLMEKDNFEKNFSKKYKSLFSPAGMFMRKMILADPVGISLEPLKRLQSFQIDTNFALYRNALFTSDQKHLVFYLKPSFQSSDSKNNGKLIDVVEQMKQKVNVHFQSQIRIEYFGAPAVAYANAQQIKRDVVLTVVIAMILVVVFVMLFYRRKRLLAIIFLPAVMAVVASVAVLYFLKGEVSAIALGMGSILVGISIDYVLHIFTHAESGHSIQNIYKDVALPILISALTTAAAFFGLLTLSSGALRDMGIFAGFSILFAALFSLLLIPLFLPSKNNAPVKENGFKTWLIPLFHYPFHRNKILLVLLIGLTPIFYYYSTKVQFNGDLNEINFMTKELKLAEAGLNKISSLSQRNVFIVSRAQQLDSALYLSEKRQETLVQLQSEGIQISIAAIQNFLPSRELQRERLVRWNNYWTTEKKNLLDENLRSIQKEYRFKPDAFDAFRRTLSKTYSPISDSAVSFIQTQFLRELIKKNEQGFAVLTQIKVPLSEKIALHEKIGNTNFYADVIDKEYLAVQFLNALKSDFNLLVLLSMALVFLIILASFGRIELALITFLPMSLSWIWTLGMMAFFGLQFNIVNIIVSTLIFGLGIDYSIFITKGLMSEYTNGQAVLPSFKTSIFFASFTTIFGIGVLIFAQHPALNSMAVISVVGLLSVLIMAFTLQPWLFYWLIDNNGKRRVIPMTSLNWLGSVYAFVLFLGGTLLTTVAGFILLVLIPGKSEKLRSLFHRILQFNSRAIVFAIGYVPKKMIDFKKEKFEKPALIICNHQSHIDIVLLLMLHPKMILLTNDWVQRNPFYGLLVRMAQFYPVLDRLEENLPLIKQKVENGYSVMIFPEGSRSSDSKIKRFHKGAFYIAEKLNLDILPVLLHGVGDCITKGENFLKKGFISVKIFDRISVHDLRFGKGYVQQSKAFRQFYIRELEALQLEQETPNYFRSKLVANYIYKGPVLEWYTKIKTRFEGNYALFHELIPQKAKIYDIGCGYGYLSLMLYLLSEQRQIVGIDYDEEKIKIAQNTNVAKSSSENRLQFETADVCSYNFQKADVFVLNDVLHYLSFEDQNALLGKCIGNLEVGGKIIIREADSDHKKHQGTRFSEWQSTKLLGFNKTKTEKKQLFFTSKKRLQNFFGENGCDLAIIDRTKLNSNLIFIAQKRRKKRGE